MSEEAAAVPMRTKQFHPVVGQALWYRKRDGERVPALVTAVWLAPYQGSVEDAVNVVFVVSGMQAGDGWGAKREYDSSVKHVTDAQEGDACWLSPLFVTNPS